MLVMGYNKQSSGMEIYLVEPSGSISSSEIYMLLKKRFLMQSYYLLNDHIKGEVFRYKAAVIGMSSGDSFSCRLFSWSDINSPTKCVLDRFMNRLEDTWNDKMSMISCAELFSDIYFGSSTPSLTSDLRKDEEPDIDSALISRADFYRLQWCAQIKLGKDMGSLKISSYPDLNAFRSAISEDLHVKG